MISFLLVSFVAAPAYEIVYPEVITQDRTFTITTEAIPADSLQLSVDAFGETVHMTLHHDDANISPDLNMIEIRDGGEFSVAVRTDCLYSGFVKSEPESLVSAETSNGLVSVSNIILFVLLNLFQDLYLQSLGRVMVRSYDKGFDLCTSRCECLPKVSLIS